MFEMGSSKPEKIETNKSFPVNSTRKYHRFPGLLYPNNHIMKYIVKGKPYISMYRATMNAK